MSQDGRVAVLDRDGLRGVIETGSGEVTVGGEPHLVVHFGDRQQVLVPAGALVERQDGSYFFPESLAELELAVRKGGAWGGEVLVVPVVAEEIRVRKREVERGGVRISKTVRERVEMIDEPLAQDEISVERVPVNRVVEGPVPIRHVGDTMIVPLLEEVLVVEKRLVLKEELHVTRRRVESRGAQQVTLRSEEASVERIVRGALGQERQDELPDAESGRP